MRVAVVDMGTNSTRLLGRRRRGRADHRARAALDGDSPRARGRHVATALGRGDRGRVRHRRRLPRADRVARRRRTSVAIATSAVRDAENSGAFVGELRERFALDARILSGDDEARLTYLGHHRTSAPDSEDDARRRHRRRLDRARRRLRLRGLLSRFARRRHRPPYRAPHHPRPGRAGRARDARQRRALADRRRARRLGLRARPQRASASRARRPRSRRSTRRSTPTTRTRSTARRSRSRRSSACTRSWPRRRSRSASR